MRRISDHKTVTLLRRIVVFSFLIESVGVVLAQPPDWLWAKGIGSTGDQEANSIAIDAEGNVYTTGTFAGTADFDPGGGVYNLSASDNIDVFVLKLNNSGEFVWAKSFDGEFGISIALDASANVYTTGRFQGSNCDFDPGTGVFTLSSAGGWDIFVSKLDTEGNFVWARRMGGTGSDFGNAITLDDLGNVFTTGSFQNTADFDPGSDTFNITSDGDDDIFVSKLDPSGNFVWAKAMGGSNYQSFSSIAADDQGNVYTTGYYWETADFDPNAGVYNLTSAGENDIFISKLDSSGNFVFAKSMGGTDNDFGSELIRDASGNIWSTGLFEGTSDFDPGSGTFSLTSAGGEDIFISKLDSAGNFELAYALGSTSVDNGASLGIDVFGAMYFTGRFSGTVDFDPGAGTFDLTAVGLRDIFVLKLDEAGNFEWAIGAGGTSSEWSNAIAFDASANTYITGFFQSPSISFGSFTLNNAGAFDIFIAKLEGTISCSLVTSSADSGPGALRDVIDCATDGATITFHSSLMDQTIVLTSGEIGIKTNLIIQGLGAEHLAISGNSASRIFHVRPGWNLELRDMTLRDATEITHGGSILVSGALTLRNILLENNFENGSPKGLTALPGTTVTVIGDVDIEE